MAATHLALDALVARLHRSATGAVIEPGTAVLVDLDEHLDGDVPEIHGGVAAVVIGTTSDGDPLRHAAATACDVVLHADDPMVEAVAAAVSEHPEAAVALAALLRGSERRALDEGLVAESASYSALQGGPEFAAWLASRRRTDRPADADPVLLEREGGVLTVTLHRPAVRNALNVAMREALIDAFDVVAADADIAEVHLRGAGEAFCSGGDLDEFGTFTDPAAAHLVRLERSVARAVATVSDRVTAHLHGACAGSGIELPAFAARVVAAPSTTISLPEVTMGLVPGAGGTVSIPRRIGRHRTALLGLSGAPIDAATALEWGLVDAVDDESD